LVADELLQADFSVIVKFLNTFPKHRVPSVNKLLRIAHSFKVTNRQLFAMERHYSSVVNPEPEEAHVVSASSTPAPALPEGSEFPLSDDEGSGGGSGSGSGTTPSKQAKHGKGLRSVFNRFVRK
jgi:hypothetical protein